MKRGIFTKLRKPMKRKHAFKRTRIAQVKSKKSKPTISRLTKDLDAIFSKYIRTKYSKDGFVACYTCGHQNLISKMHAGHYLSRYYKASRWDENNVRPQCVMCNLWKRGDPIVFRENLVKEIGEPAVLELEKSRRRITKLDTNELIKQIDIYKEKFNSLIPSDNYGLVC